MTKFRIAVALAWSASIGATPALAHGGPHAAPALATPGYHGDPLVVAGLVALALAYGVGHRRLRARSTDRTRALRRQGIAFGLSWLTLVIALLSPLDAMSDVLFSAHMVQHELLMLIAAPLLVYARPLSAYLFALPFKARDRILGIAQSRPVLTTFRALTGPLFALIVHAFVRWVWHYPALFEAALRSEWVHGFQHFTFFVSATAFWWALLHGRYGKLGHGVAVLFVFATSMHTGALGALITFARTPLYPTHAARVSAFDRSPLLDQQLAGLVMWVGAGLLFMVLGLALFMAWLGEAGRRAERTALSALMREARERELHGASAQR